MIPDPIEGLLGRLDLEDLGGDRFRGDHEPNAWGRLFGGMVAAQALSAVYRTVPRSHCAHSLHAYFLRAGDPNTDVTLSVDRIRDGRSFITRRVVAEQKGTAIFNMSASFHVTEESQHEHAFAMPPDCGDPDQLPSWADLAKPMFDKLPAHARQRMNQVRPIELRFTIPPTFLGGGPSEGPNNVWFRAASALPEDPRIHQAVMTYASDMSLLDNIVRPHAAGFDRANIMMASLDHAIWFHRSGVRADEWMLYHQDSPAAAGARGFARGSIYTRDGRLVASVAQEGLMRTVDPKRVSGT